MKNCKTIRLMLVFIMFLFVFAPGLQGQGKFEFGFHYSRWSLNIIKGFVEDALGESMESTFRDDFLADIQEDYPGLTEDNYEQDVSFDSSGSNFGFEARWYPAGRHGSFSLGLSVEKTSMEISIPELSAQMDMDDGSYYEADANASFIINPLSFHLSFRWDIIPSSPIHPYITFGLGAATGTALDEAEFSYAYSGTYYIEGGDSESFEDSETKTLKELKEEMEDDGEDFFLPGFIPFIQINLGLKAEITDNLHLLVDAGIWDGFLLRGGIAFRF